VKLSRGSGGSTPYIALADIALATMGFLAVAWVVVLVRVRLQPDVEAGAQVVGSAEARTYTSVFEGAGWMGYFQDCERLIAVVPADITVFCDFPSGTLLMVRRHAAVRVEGRDFPAATVFSEFRGRFDASGFRGMPLAAALSAPGGRVCPVSELHVRIEGDRMILREFDTDLELTRRAALRD
jgi:hypothetical protein